MAENDNVRDDPILTSHLCYFDTFFLSRTNLLTGFGVVYMLYINYLYTSVKYSGDIFLLARFLHVL